ncbi:MAG: hypothetical protein IJ055_06115 [Oscillospiraceae bacterium]|nr:hypothetical protein [Oscillospiraceae bacterium]
MSKKKRSAPSNVQPAPPEAPPQPAAEEVKEPRFEAFARLVISVLMVFVMGLLSVCSLLHTTGMQIVPEGGDVDTSVMRIKEGLETVVYHNDNVLANLFMLCLCGLVCFLVMPYLKKLPLWAELVFLSAWTILLGAVWVNSSMVAPSEDSSMVTGAAMGFAKGDFSALEGRYFRNYSFQLGYVFFTEILIRIAGLFGTVERPLFIETLNAVFLAGTYAGLVLINHTVFKDQRVRHLTVFLLAFGAQPIIFCTFLYGILPGLCFAVWALYLEIVYFKKDKLWCGILSVLCIALAVLIKSNYSITLVAMVCIAFVKLFSRKKQLLRDGILLVAGVLLTVSLSPMVKYMYERRSGMDLEEQVPFISWFAMGLNEPTFPDTGPGWYRASSTVGNFETYGFDPDAAAAASRQNIRDRLAYFRENPQYANDFFARKFVSQWNETTYQSIWNNQVRRQYEDKGPIAAKICGDWQSGTERWMDLYAQLIFAGVFLGVAAALKNRDFLSMSVPLVILGGVMYHMLSEAKSQYAMPYFILMMGFAAYGICIAYDRIVPKLRQNKYLAKVFPEADCH